MTPGRVIVGTLLLTATLGCLLVALTAAAEAQTTQVSIADTRWLINGAVTYQGAPAEGLLMNARMVNSVFEDTKRDEFDPDANTTEFLAVMDAYVASGVRAFTISLQGGDPGYEGAVNTAFTEDGELRDAYLARVARVIERADDLGAVIILSLFYQRQDQRLKNEAAVKNAVVQTARWVRQQGYTNVLLEIANEYPHWGFTFWIIRSSVGVASLITLAKQTAPEILVSASGMGAYIDARVVRASDFVLLHGNNVAINDFDKWVALANQKANGNKPIVFNEDPKVGPKGADAASMAVKLGASWGLWFKPNQYWPFVFRGPADDPIVYARIRQLTTP